MSKQLGCSLEHSTELRRSLHGAPTCSGTGRLCDDDSTAATSDADCERCPNSWPSYGDHRHDAAWDGAHRRDRADPVLLVERTGWAGSVYGAARVCSHVAILAASEHRRSERWVGCERRSWNTDRSEWGDRGDIQRLAAPHVQQGHGRTVARREQLEFWRCVGCGHASTGPHISSVRRFPVELARPPYAGRCGCASGGSSHRPVRANDAGRHPRGTPGFHHSVRGANEPVLMWR
jgi:hypothetical protein